MKKRRNQRSGIKRTIEALEARSLLAVLTVTSPVDGAAGSLRDVLDSAAEGDVVRFSPALRNGHLKLTEGELNVDVSVTIEGTGQTLDAGGQSRIMLLDASGTSISLSGLTFVGGVAPGDPNRGTFGGAILAEGITLEICGSHFRNNSAASTSESADSAPFMQDGGGGAIAAFDSKVTVCDSGFAGNVASGADNTANQQPSAGMGGAIFADNSEVVIERSRFTANAARGGSGIKPIEAYPSSDGGWGAGGAIFATAGSMNVSATAFLMNKANGGKGLDGTRDNPFGNEVGAGGNASGGAVWVAGDVSNGHYRVPLELRTVLFAGNSSNAGAAGAQGVSTLAAQQGGRAIGGGLATVQGVAVSISKVRFDHNVAQGGGAGPNADNAGSDTGTGGVAEGGAAYLESTSNFEATSLHVRHNVAEGGKGANSAPDSGTEAGEGGYAYGGGILLYNDTGGLGGKSPLPVSIRNASFVANKVLGGQAGSGTEPADGLGAGGIAQGGGLNFVSLFDSSLVQVRFIANKAIAGQGKFAAGGGLANPYGEAPDGVQAGMKIQGALFRGNLVIGGADAANAAYRDSAGGAFLNNGRDVVIADSRFVGNRVLGGKDTGSGHVGSAAGGAISSTGQYPTMTITDTAFFANKAIGGRRTVHGVSLEEEVSGEARGGAIRFDVGTVSISGGLFSHNKAIVPTPSGRTAEGGAIDVVFVENPDYDYVANLDTNDVRFLTNIARAHDGVANGGAIAFTGTRYLDSGSIFGHNFARASHPDGSAYGGALYLTTDSALDSTLIARNGALAPSGYGGGIALPNGPDVLIRTGTRIRRNKATTAGNDEWWPLAT